MTIMSGKITADRLADSNILVNVLRDHVCRSLRADFSGSVTLYRIIIAGAIMLDLVPPFNLGAELVPVAGIPTYNRF